MTTKGGGGGMGGVGVAHGPESNASCIAWKQQVSKEQRCAKEIEATYPRSEVDTESNYNGMSSKQSESSFRTTASRSRMQRLEDKIQKISGLVDAERQAKAEMNQTLTEIRDLMAHHFKQQMAKNK